MVNSINVRGYGSLVNAMGNQTRSLQPEVGMGVTQLGYSDRHPYTVTAILSPNRIQVKPDKATRIDKNGCCDSQEYTYELDNTSPAITLFLNKFNRWKRVGDAQGSTYLIGRREEYYDFTL
jgi:hypothetical protein